MSDECSAFIYQDFITEYQELHKAVCLNLNKLIWSIVFLKKAKEAQEKGVSCRNDFIIEHLYKNEFELMVLRLSRTLFDEGQDVITLKRLRNNFFSKYILPEHKYSLSNSLKDINWDSSEIVAARRKLECAIPIFRNNYVAHTLMGETEEVSVSYLDAEKVVMAACDLLNRLSFGVDSFYLGKEKSYLKFFDEKTAVEQFIEEFFLFQQTSAWSINKLDCDSSSKIVKENIKKMNIIFSNFK